MTYPERLAFAGLLLGVVLIGCSSAGSSPTPSISTTASAAADQATPAPASVPPPAAASASDPASAGPSSDGGSRPPDLATIVGLDPSARLACFGGSTITFEATVSKAISDCGIGPRIEPAWFCLPGVFVDVPAPADGPGPLDVYWDPASGITPASFPTDRTVRITGHFDDPAAATCHVTSVPAGQSRATPDAVVLACRETFVVTGVK